MSSFDFEEAAHGAVCAQLAQSDDALPVWHRVAPVDERAAVLPVELLAYASIGASRIHQVMRKRPWQGCRR